MIEKIFKGVGFIVTYKLVMLYFISNMTFAVMGVTAFYVFFPMLEVEIWMGLLIKCVGLFIILSNGILATLYAFGTFSDYIEVNINWKKLI